MKRRNFIKAAAAAGVALTFPLVPSGVRAAAEAYAGPYFIFVNAGGGWDPRLLFDPTTDPLQNRLTQEIAKVGAISYCPFALDLAALGFDPDYGYESLLVEPKTFLSRHGSRVCVLNGVDMETNNHDAGTRATWSGRLEEGYPSLGALIAATHAPNQPMAFLSAGGYDATNGLVPLTRTGNADDLRKLAFPNRIDPGNAENLDTYHNGATYDRIRNAENQRLADLLKRDYLPRYRGTMAELQMARVRSSDLASLVIPEDLVELQGYQLGGLQNNMRQAQVGIAAFQAGISATLNLSVGGFDTHGNHDRDQPNHIVQLLTLVDFVVARVAAAGLTDKTVIFVGSDFGRGPFYNDDNAGAGKDHWPVTSFFGMGPGIAGNRVVGATNAEQKSIGVDSTSLATIEGGVVLHPGHINDAIRRLAGVTELAQQFPLKESKQPLALFG